MHMLSIVVAYMESLLSYGVLWQYGNKNEIVATN